MTLRCVWVVDETTVAKFQRGLDAALGRRLNEAFEKWRERSVEMFKKGDVVELVEKGALIPPVGTRATVTEDQKSERFVVVKWDGRVCQMDGEYYPWHFKKVEEAKMLEMGDRVMLKGGTKAIVVEKKQAGRYVKVRMLESGGNPFDYPAGDLELVMRCPTFKKGDRVKLLPKTVRSYAALAGALATVTQDYAPLDLYVQLEWDAEGSNEQRPGGYFPEDVELAKPLLWKKGDRLKLVQVDGMKLPAGSLATVKTDRLEKSIFVDVVWSSPEQAGGLYEARRFELATPDAPKPEPLKVGDVVTLPSDDGVAMTVTNTYDGKTVQVSYFDADLVMHQQLLPVAALRRSEG